MSPIRLDGETFVRALTAGSPSALGVLYDRHVRRVARLLGRILGPDSELEDAVHETFLRALESLPKLRDPNRIETWLLGIAVRVGRDVVRRRARRRWLRFTAPEELPERTATEASPEARAALRQMLEVFSTLSADDRIAFVLHDVEGWTLQEASTITQTSGTTFKRRLARARARVERAVLEHPELVDYQTRSGTKAGNLGDAYEGESA